MNRTRYGQLVGADESIFTDISFGLVLQRGHSGKAPSVLPGRPAVALKIGPVLRRDDGNVLVGIIHQLPVLVQEFIERLLGKALDPGLERQLRILAAGVHRVELDTPRLAHVVQGALLASEPVFSKQALLQQDKISGFLYRHCDHVWSPRPPSGL